MIEGIVSKTLSMFAFVLANFDLDITGIPNSNLPHSCGASSTKYLISKESESFNDVANCAPADPAP